MANARNGNSFYVDAASDPGTAASFIDQKGLRVSAIVFTGVLAGDSLVLSDKSATSAAAGTLKIKVVADRATQTVPVPLDGNPLYFPNGIWVTSISAGCTATLVGG